MTKLPALPTLALALVVAGCAERLAVTPVDNEAAAGIEAGLSHRCAHGTATTLAGLGLDAGDIGRVQIFTEHQGGDSGSRYVSGHRAWVRLDGQPGHLVIVLDPHCRLEQAYLEGGARLPGT
jgi:hypothetical protein